MLIARIPLPDLEIPAQVVRDSHLPYVEIYTRDVPLGADCWIACTHAWPHTDVIDGTRLLTVSVTDGTHTIIAMVPESVMQHQAAPDTVCPLCASTGQYVLCEQHKDGSSTLARMLRNVGSAVAAAHARGVAEGRQQEGKSMTRDEAMRLAEVVLHICEESGMSDLDADDVRSSLPEIVAPFLETQPAPDVQAQDRFGEIESCGACGAEQQLIWTAPDDLWLAINGERDGVLCDRCFDVRCRERGWFIRWVPRREQKGEGAKPDASPLLGSPKGQPGPPSDSDHSTPAPDVQGGDKLAGNSDVQAQIDAAVERERGRVIGIFVGELQKLHEKTVLDCGDNSCLFATRRGGMRTNGGCRCIERLLDAAVAREREECAETCLRIWREATNRRSDFRQNAISHGCIASADAIRARSGAKGV